MSNPINSEEEEMTIPQEVSNAAALVEHFFEKQGKKFWQLRGLADRKLCDHLEKAAVDYYAQLCAWEKTARHFENLAKEAEYYKVFAEKAVEASCRISQFRELDLEMGSSYSIQGVTALIDAYKGLKNQHAKLRDHQRGYSELGKKYDKLKGERDELRDAQKRGTECTGTYASLLAERDKLKEERDRLRDNLGYRAC